MIKKTLENLLITTFVLIYLMIILSVIGFLVNNTDIAPGRIALINIKGPIYIDSDPYVGTDTFKEWIDLLEKVEVSKKFKAVVIRIDSPGGTPGASQELYNSILRIKKSGKKVIISMGDVCASGGYYIASAGDIIFANPSTLTGSIGVIMSYPVIEKMEKTLGIDMVTIKSDEHKDIGSMHRIPTMEENEIFKGIIKDTYSQFVKDISKARKMSEEKMYKLADGRIYTGNTALKNGLVDKIGGIREAIEEARNIAGLPVDEEVSELELSGSFLNSLISMSVNRFVGQLKSKFKFSLSY